MTKNQKIGTTIGVIVGVIVTGFLVQLARFYDKIKDLKPGEGVIFDNSYFPFNGVYAKSDTSGQRTTGKNNVQRGQVCTCPDGSAGFKPAFGDCQCNSKILFHGTGRYTRYCSSNGGVSWNPCG